MDKLEIRHLFFLYLTYTPTKFELVRVNNLRVTGLFEESILAERHVQDLQIAWWELAKM